jgi:hypothetical protein
MKTQKKSHEHEQPNENKKKYYHCSIEKEQARYLEPNVALWNYLSKMASDNLTLGKF